MCEKKCIFCEGSVRKHFSSGFESLFPCETIQAQDSILNCARQLKNKDFLREYGHIDFIAKEVKYYKTCRARYINKAAKIQGKESSSMYTKKKRVAFVRLLSCINSELLMKKVSMKLVDVNKIYIDFLTEEGFEEPSTSDPYNLSSKIKEHYDSKIQFHQKCKKQGIYLSITHDAMDKKIMNAALFLREKILKLHENKLPNPITVEAIQDG